MTLKDLGEKSVLLLGFGVEGQATYEFLLTNFPGKRIAIADRRSSEEVTSQTVAYPFSTNTVFHCGKEYLEAIDQYEIIVKTPGIPSSTPALISAHNQGCVITSHLEIFFDLFDSQRIIGITGTKGKSTTTSLIYKILYEAGVEVFLGGNIGEPPLRKVHHSSPNSLFVLELSSYQLEQLRKSPHIAVLLNIVPEHLDYHKNFLDYVYAKENITRFQSDQDLLIYNYDYTLPREIAEKSSAKLFPFSMTTPLDSGCYVEGDKIIYSDNQNREVVIIADDIPLLGDFNKQNILAAIAIAKIIGVQSNSIKNSVRSFEALPHRLEYVGEFQGIRFYDDSISTIPECTLSALEALGSDVQTLILGGHERNLDYSSFGLALLRTAVKNVILFPPTGKRIWDAILTAAAGNEIPFQKFPVETMQDAIKIAFAYTNSSKICLLSPGSASFSKFKDYRDRGDAFKKCIRAYPDI
jgi:UDP-N-acetylmuramoylalanine--D-glutamate ligase